MKKPENRGRHMKQPERTLDIVTNGPPLDIDETASLLAFLITKGDATSYLNRIREIQQQRKAGEQSKP